MLEKRVGGLEGLAAKVDGGRVATLLGLHCTGNMVGPALVRGYTDMARI